MAKKSKKKLTSGKTLKELPDGAIPAAPESPGPPVHAGWTRLRLSSRRKKSIRPESVPRLPAAHTIFITSLRTLWLHKKLFLGILAVYLLLTVVFVGGLSKGADLAGLKDAIGNPGGLTQIAAGFALFTVLLTTSGNTSSQAAGAYQSFILLIASLAIIWALRQVMAGERIRVRDAFYQGMYPLVPVVLVIFVIGIQLLPMLIGAFLYEVVVANGIAATALEQLLWALLFFALSLITLYLITASIIALYIAALPNMPPMNALRSARELVRWRRWAVLRKLLFLPLALFVLAAVIMLPVILWLTPAAQWLFFLLGAVGVAVVHSYLYTLYRELLP